MLYAAVCLDWDAVLAFLADGVDPNASLPATKPLLISAILDRSLPVIEQLIECKADVESTYSANCTLRVARDLNQGLEAKKKYVHHEIHNISVEFTALYLAVEMYASAFNYLSHVPAPLKASRLRLKPSVKGKLTMDQENIIRVIQMLIAGKANKNAKINAIDHGVCQGGYGHGWGQEHVSSFKLLNKNPSNKTVMKMAQSYHHLSRRSKQGLVDLLNGKIFIS